ncbi:MAG: 3-deoxy-7-phosphoheptulonate synthase [Actinomycetota bacterium]|nr:3-deoxy-7-phosphoheptulonate synthase [Actinomycetota bacterium]MDD5667175.1 3-deoxy-7-phosphoheptulonate synthase [Actinomycetota bacterium]
MIVVMSQEASRDQVEAVLRKIEEFGLQTHPIYGVQKTVIGVIGDDKTKVVETMAGYPGVEQIIPILKPYKFASRETHPQDTVIELSGVRIGGDKVVVMAGPCAVESPEQILNTARLVKLSGGSILRGGAYKPRTSPYSFQGLGEEGLRYLAEAREETGLPVVTEITDPRKIDLFCEYADIIQVGARNMQNFVLLTEIGRSGHPVLLKRGPSSKIEDLLLAAEYIIKEGNRNIILCERGISTFETYTRNTLDLSAVAAIKKLSHLPVVVDPSHSVGIANLVTPMSMAAVAAGADGLIVEIHPNPNAALCDGSQSLDFETFSALMTKLRKVAAAIGRDV